MVAILGQLHQYIPSVESTATCRVQTEDVTQEDKVLNVKLHRILFAGDQLTVKRTRSARAQ